MGFSCFACSRGFEETVPPPNLLNGAGDAEVKIRPVTAITKCGHMFHTDCLKRALGTQSGNAWEAKKCPVCRLEITMSDLVRVHANPCDASQRPRIEEMMIQYRKLREEYEKVLRTVELLRTQIRELNMEIQRIRYREQEMASQMDQLVRCNGILKAELERAVTEKDKLKNIIINLTERFACNEIPMSEYYSVTSSSMNASNGNVRLEYTEELQRMPMSDSNLALPASLLNGTIPKSTHHHPPGLFYPVLKMENRSDYQDSDRGSQAASLSPENLKSPDHINGISMLDLGKSKPTMHILPMENTHQQQGRITSFALHDVQVRDYDANNNSAGSRKMMEDNSNSTHQVNSFSPKENVAASSSSCSAYSSQNGSLANSMIEKNETCGATAVSTENVTIVEDEGFDDVDDAVEKWYEKKSRRRGSSRGSGGAGTSKGGRSSGKFQVLADKKLLYCSFACPTCKAKWGSSQSVLNTPQTCRYCNTEVHPYSQGPILSRKQLEINKETKASRKASATVTETNNKKK